MIGVLIRREEDTYREKGHVKTEADNAVTQLQAKDCQGLPEESRKDSSLESSEGSWSCRHIDSSLLASRTVRGKTFILSHQVCGNLLGQS